MTVNDLFGVKESQSKLTKELPRKGNVVPVVARNVNNGMGMLNSNGINNNHNFGRNNTGGMIGTSNGLYGINNGLNIGNTGNIGNISNGIGNVNGVLGMIKNNQTGATIPKANTNGPFRTLFGDDGTAQSPQFKNI